MGASPREPAHISIAVGGDADELMKLVAAEGWNPGRIDASVLEKIDPRALHVAKVGGQVVGGIGLTRQQEDYAYLGYFVVDKELRGTGVGRSLWHAAFADAGEVVVGLDAVGDLVDFYRARGFADEWRTARWVGDLVVPSATGSRGCKITPVALDDLPECIALDARLGGLRRERFIAEWFMAPGMNTAIARSDGGRVLGCAAARQAIDGWRVGPVYADTDGVAGALLTAIVPRNETPPRVTIHSPEWNATAAQFYRSCGLVDDAHTVRMYRGTKPIAAEDTSLFGISSPEIG